MTVICPCVTADNPSEYQKQLDAVSALSQRLHIDIADGKLAPRQLVNPINLHWPAGTLADIHVMYQQPKAILETLIALQPHLIILHAEAEDLPDTIAALTGFGIKVGVALLAGTSTDSIKPWLEQLDHVLIFSGDLGHFGGQADLSLLTKVEALRGLKPELEIGWDGGINGQNIKQLAEAGVSVFDVGGYLQNATEPKESYEELQAQLGI